jgi:protein kinase C substrate 80K-H
MLENLKKKEEFDYGPRRVFAALDSKCFSYDAGQYSYEMCFFGSATQRFDGTQMHLG